MTASSFLRRHFLCQLLLVSALLAVSLGQDSTSTEKPTQEDCSAASASGTGMPAGCSQDEGTGGAAFTRQQQESTPTRAPQLTSGRGETTERETTVPLNPSQRRRVELPPRPHSEFEQIVADTVGRPLPLFGQSLFVQPPSTFAPTDHVQVPGDYVVGPDDELQIRIWGQLNADLRVVVDRSGQVYIPRVGQISVAGIHFSELNQHLKNQIQKLFRNFDLTVNVGKIRSIQVYVVGQARYPGTYTISSLSTLVNAIFASGGPTPQGSLRDVQVQRDGRTIAHLDFYELLIKGDKSKDVRLQAGDVLYFPPVGPLVAAAGSVNTPAIYEMKRGGNLAELIEIAGGLSTVADSNKVAVERIGDKTSRSAVEFPLDVESRGFLLADGDIVRVLSIVPSFSNTVTLRGNVVDPGRYAWKQGMRVHDLIPDAQALITRSYWIGRAGIIDGSSTEYPIRDRRTDSEVRYGSTYYGNTYSQNSNSRTTNIGETGSSDLQNGSADYVGGSQSSNNLNGTVPYGSIQNGTNPYGTNQRPGNPTDRNLTVGELTESDREQSNVPGHWQSKDITSQSGPRPPRRPTLTTDLHRDAPEINWNYAIIQRVNPVDLSTKLLSFDLGKAVLANDAVNNLELQPGDIITVFSQADMSVPQSTRSRYIEVEGEVLRPGVYKAEDGESLRDVIRRAGGVTADAYIYGTRLTRESARVEQQQSLDELSRTLETEIRQASVAMAARGTAEDTQAAAASQASQEALITQMRGVRATGRVVLTLKPSANSIDAFPAIAVEDNDRVVIPHLPATVSVVGMVYNAGSFVFNPRSKAGDYLKLAGKGKPNADMHHTFVLHADGTVVASTAVNGLFSGDKFAALQMHPGDQIVVPTKIQTGALVRGLKDWSQIASQLALTGAALAVIH